MNSTRNDGILSNEGQNEWMKLINNPLIWDPSWSCGYKSQAGKFLELITISRHQAGYEISTHRNLKGRLQD